MDWLWKTVVYKRALEKRLGRKFTLHNKIYLKFDLLIKIILHTFLSVLFGESKGRR